MISGGIFFTWTVCRTRVKLGNFGHQVNSDIPLQTVEIQMRRPSHQDFHCLLTRGGGSICNENPFITPSTNSLGLNAICQTKGQSVAVIMVHENLINYIRF